MLENVIEKTRFESAICMYNSNRCDSQVQSTGATHKCDSQVRSTSAINRCDSQVKSIELQVQSLQVCKDQKFTSSKVNRILSKVQKSFWSCTHVNSCQKYTLYINLHILLDILSKATSNIQESRKSIKFLKR